LTIVGVTMVRDEEDIIDKVLRHLLAEGVDHLIVADNLSTDRTPHLLNDLEACGAPVTIVQDPEVGYYQDRKMSRLARQAYDMGADWVLPFDADEVWYAPQHDSIRQALTAMPDDVMIVRAPGWDHVGPGPFSGWRRAGTQPLCKVAFRAHPKALIHMGNHDVGRPGAARPGVLAFRHFQYRSLQQMTRKLRNGREAYEAADIHPLQGTHWRSGGLKSDAEQAADWDAFCNEEGLVFDPAPLRVTV
jgi:glycosyltransferase involved in cell wall biosynthesis